MPHSRWSDALALGLPVMDDTHEEFFQMLAALIAAPENEVVERWSELVTHTQAHFAREDQWMTATGFSSSNCHISQHHAVLEVMLETLGRGGPLDDARSAGLERQVAGNAGELFDEGRGVVGERSADHHSTRRTWYCGRPEIGIRRRSRQQRDIPRRRSIVHWQGGDGRHGHGQRPLPKRFVHGHQ